MTVCAHYGIFWNNFCNLYRRHPSAWKNSFPTQSFLFYPNLWNFSRFFFECGCSRNPFEVAFSHFLDKTAIHNAIGSLYIQNLKIHAHYWIWNKKFWKHCSFQFKFRNILCFCLRFSCLGACHCDTSHSNHDTTICKFKKLFLPPNCERRLFGSFRTIQQQ